MSITEDELVDSYGTGNAKERCDTDGGILKDTDNPEKHKKDIWTIAMMRREYEVFDSFLNALN